MNYNDIQKDHGYRGEYIYEIPCSASMIIWFQGLWGVWLAFSGRLITASKMVTHFSAILKKDNCSLKLVFSESSKYLKLYNVPGQCLQ